MTSPIPQRYLLNMRGCAPVSMPQYAGTTFPRCTSVCLSAMEKTGGCIARLRGREVQRHGSGTYFSGTLLLHTHTALPVFCGCSSVSTTCLPCRSAATVLLRKSAVMVQPSATLAMVTLATYLPA